MPLNKASARGSTVLPTSVMQGVVLGHLPKLASDLGGQSRAGSLADLKLPPLFAAVKQHSQSTVQAPLGERSRSHVSPLSWLSSGQPMHRPGQRWSKSLAAGELSRCWRGLAWGRGTPAGLEFERNSKNFFRSCTTSFQCRASLYQARDWNLAAAKLK